jgi:hypothetical protein
MAGHSERAVDCMPDEALAFYGGRAAVLAALGKGAPLSKLKRPVPCAQSVGFVL